MPLSESVSESVSQLVSQSCLMRCDAIVPDNTACGCGCACAWNAVFGQASPVCTWNAIYIYIFSR